MCGSHVTQVRGVRLLEPVKKPLDLHLTSTATAAIDRGASVSNVTDDFDGRPRPAGSAYDIGADEFR